jgi:hypothetical protein
MMSYSHSIDRRAHPRVLSKFKATTAKVSPMKRTLMIPSLALGAALLLGPVLSSLPASAATATTSSIIATAKATLAKQVSVHLVVAVKSSSSSTLEIADLGKTTGVETIASGSANAKVEITPKFGYMEGDSTGLTSLIGLTAAEAKKLGTKWMSLKAGTSPYSDLKSAATIPATDGLLPAAKGTTSSTERSGGAEFYVLKWTTAATSSAPKLSNTLTISTGKTPLPVKEITSDSTASETTTFTKWGEKVAVTDPATASTIPYTTIVG